MLGGCEELGWLRLCEPGRWWGRPVGSRSEVKRELDDRTFWVAERILLGAHGGLCAEEW